MDFEPIPNTKSFQFHITLPDDPDQREVSIKWGDKTITIASPVLDQADKHMSYMCEDHFAGDTELVELELKEGTTVYLDLTRITQDDKGTHNEEQLRAYAETAIRRIGVEKENALFKSALEKWANKPTATVKEKAGRIKAKRRIFECRETSSTSLYLACLGLTTLPPELGQLAQLTHLYLFENQLTSIPPELGQLAQLIHLNLYANRLTSIPQEFGQLA